MQCGLPELEADFPAVPALGEPRSQRLAVFTDLLPLLGLVGNSHQPEQGVLADFVVSRLGAGDLQESGSRLDESSGEQIAFGEAETCGGDVTAAGVFPNQLPVEHVSFLEVVGVGVHSRPFEDQPVAVLGLGELFQQSRVGRVGLGGLLVEGQQAGCPTCSQEGERTVRIGFGRHPVCRGRLLGLIRLLETLGCLVGRFGRQLVLGMQHHHPSEDRGGLGVLLRFEQAPAAARESCGVEGRAGTQGHQVAEEPVGSLKVLLRVGRFGHSSNRLSVDRFGSREIGQLGQSEIRAGHLALPLFRFGQHRQGIRGQGPPGVFLEVLRGRFGCRLVLFVGQETRSRQDQRVVEFAGSVRVLDRGEDGAEGVQHHPVVAQSAADSGQLVPGTVADCLRPALGDRGAKECLGVLEVGVPPASHFQPSGLQTVPCRQLAPGVLAFEPVDQFLDLVESPLSRGRFAEVLGGQQHRLGGEQQPLVGFGVLGPPRDDALETGGRLGVPAGTELGVGPLELDVTGQVRAGLAGLGLPECLDGLVGPVQCLEAHASPVIRFSGLVRAETG